MNGAFYEFVIMRTPAEEHALAGNVWIEFQSRVTMDGILIVLFFGHARELTRKDRLNFKASLSYLLTYYKYGEL